MERWIGREREVGLTTDDVAETCLVGLGWVGDGGR